jgi:hypothetical protein
MIDDDDDDVWKVFWQDVHDDFDIKQQLRFVR